MSSSNPSDGSGDDDGSSIGDYLPTETVSNWYRNHKFAFWGVMLLMFFPTIVGTPLSLAFADELVVFHPLFDIWWWRPKFHAIYYALYAAPWFVEYTTLAVVSFLASGTLYQMAKDAPPEKTSAYKWGGRIAGVVVVWAIIGLVIAFVFSGILAAEELADQTAPEVTNTSELPEMNSDHPRIATRKYSKQLASNNLRENTLQVGSQDDITFLRNAEGESVPHWSYALEPATVPKRYFGYQAGAVYVPMDSGSPEVKIVRGEMQCGMGVSMTDNHKWQYYKQDGNYNTKMGETFVITDKSENYIAVPQKGRQAHIETVGIWPVHFTTPTFEGVGLFDSECNYQDLSPEEATQHPVTENQNFYPYTLTEKRVKSLRWTVGWFDKNIDHNNDFRVADTPGEGNSQPFLIQTADGGLKYVTAVEPYGENTNGIYKIFITDAQTGQMERYKIKGESLVGPQAAANYIEQESPKVSWDRYEKSEPLPVKVDGHLHWMYRIMSTGDSSGIAYVAFVNASSVEDVRLFSDTDNAIAYMQTGNDMRNKTGTNANVTEGEDGGMVLKIMEDTDGDGIPDKVVRTIPLDDNESVVVQEKENNSTAKNSTG